MTLDRQPAYDAVHDKIHAFETNVIANSVIWRCVQAALDAIEDELAAHAPRVSEVWVITLDAKLISFTLTRRAARRLVKRWHRQSGTNTTPYEIHRVMEGTP